MLKKLLVIPAIALLLSVGAPAVAQDEIGELAASIANLRSILNAEIADVPSDLDTIRDFAQELGRQMGSDLACGEFEQENIRSAATDLHLLISLVTPMPVPISIAAFENMVRQGTRLGCEYVPDSSTDGAILRLVERTHFLRLLMQEIERRETHLGQLIAQNE